MLTRPMLFGLVLVFSSIIIIKCEDSTDEDSILETSTQMPITNLVSLFRREFAKGFVDIRKQHKDLLKRVFEIAREREDWDRVLKVLIEDYCKKLSEYRLEIDKYPSLDNLIVATVSNFVKSLPNSMENIIYQAELGIAFPDTYKNIFTNDETVNEILTWGVQFAKSSALYSPEDSLKLDIFAKEIGLLPKGDKFRNKYKFILEGNLQAQAQDRYKKKKEKRKRGPGLSGEL